MVRVQEWPAFRLMQRATGICSKMQNTHEYHLKTKRLTLFLILADDLIYFQHQFSNEQKTEIIENAFQNIDSLLAKLSKNEMGRYFDLCFKINGYQTLLTIANNRKKKREVEHFIVSSLLSTNSHTIVTHALVNICQITTRSRWKKRKLYNEYKLHEMYYYSEDDGVDERLISIIEKFKKLCPIAI